MYTYIYIYIYTYVCIYIYIYTCLSGQLESDGTAVTEKETRGLVPQGRFPPDYQFYDYYYYYYYYHYDC